MEEIKLNLENLSEEERGQLMKLVEKANKPKVGRWKPKDCDKYWFFNTEKYMIEERVYRDRNPYHYHDVLIGNCFKTKEEVGFALEKLKVEVELQDIAKELNGDWILNIKDEGQVKYNLRYNAYTKDIEVVVHNTFLHRDIYFKDEDCAYEAIDRIGEERLKKYYFEVE